MTRSFWNRSPPRVWPSSGISLWFAMFTKKAKCCNKASSVTNINGLFKASIYLLNCFQIAFGFQFDGESFGGLLETMSNSGGVGKAVSNFLNMLGLQVEVSGIAFGNHPLLTHSPKNLVKKNIMNFTFLSSNWRRLLVLPTLSRQTLAIKRFEGW